MNFGVYSLHLVLAALLHASALKAAHIPPKDGGKSKNEVVPFMDVYTKSQCNTREVLVDILQEYPDDIESTYIPSCVVLNRCAGCCNDEALECGPKETQTVTMEVLRVRQGFAQHKYQLNFTEHTKCECRPKQELKTKKENRCEPCSERRKRLFVQDPLTCTCSCKFTQLHCKSRQLELNERTCRCDKPRR
ncbi:vascular endothelial growth factor A-A isoform X1 [Astyanax mexicanus]|uniref:Vascular endothelial growth factor A-A-like isoform X1 n=2 Tax=Astyanax mexicanus TaxID=7994 RepID=A0A8T2M5G8_ASTMX|nr:vascular endothelial growth factor A-A isoform X1 [Astyanax mexicanus]KAG9278337.1 vascular endothelial growth factor A-A-like isoform X1 [Astyanax mexicanus]